MRIDQLWLRDFRSYEELELELSAGTCVLIGPNGVGKSNLIEAIGYAARLESFRGAPVDALIRSGSNSAVVRARVMSDQREQLIEAEISSGGRNRVFLNRQRLSRSSDLLGAVRTTIFSPVDLELIKGGPALRRSYLDQLLIQLDPRTHSIKTDFERSLRQRNALLKQAKGRLDDAARLTLEVWDSKLVSFGERLADLRHELVIRLGPLVQRAYQDVAETEIYLTIEYDAPWRDIGLLEALGSTRSDELRRGITLVGPHRDELVTSLQSMPARTHASQGEQRTAALALRLAGHRLVTDTHGAAPILLLDDVFSELDDSRSRALVDSLPPGQRIITTAIELPDRVQVDQLLRVGSGSVVHLL